MLEVEFVEGRYFKIYDGKLNLTNGEQLTVPTVEDLAKRNWWDLQTQLRLEPLVEQERGMDMRAVERDLAECRKRVGELEARLRRLLAEKDVRPLLLHRLRQASYLAAARAGLVAAGMAK